MVALVYRKPLMTRSNNIGCSSVVISWRLFWRKVEFEQPSVIQENTLVARRLNLCELWRRSFQNNWRNAIQPGRDVLDKLFQGFANLHTVRGSSYSGHRLVNRWWSIIIALPLDVDFISIPKLKGGKEDSPKFWLMRLASDLTVAIRAVESDASDEVIF